MKFAFPFALLGILGLTLAGCSTTAQLTPQPGNQQLLRYDDGKPVLVSFAKSQVAIIQEAQTFESNGRANVVVAVANGTMTPFNFSPSDITFEFNGEMQHVYTYDELLSEQKSREAWSAVALALAGVSNAMAASNQGYSYTSGNVTARGPGGTAYGTFSGYTYDPSKAAAARARASAQTQADFDALARSSSETRAMLKSEILKLNTVSPQSLVGGKVVFDIPPPNDSPTPALLRVRTGDEVHEFRFMYSKVK